MNSCTSDGVVAESSVQGFPVKMSQREQLIKSRQNAATKINKRLRKETRLTPWRDTWELQSVGRCLLSVLQLPSTTIEEALDTVNIWKARSHAMEAIPHAVEATAALAQVYWRDHIQGGVSATELRLAYSSAVVRCINGFADALQQQRFLAAPVSMLCGQLGIPSWLVDIRHEASHNALPTLPVLRLATTTLLEFLENEYWIPTCPNWCVDRDEPLTCESPSHEMLAPRPIDILVQYKACASKLLQDTTFEDDKAIPVDEPVVTKKMTKPVTTKQAPPKPFDTFFGDDDDEDDESSVDDELEDSIIGGFWSPSIGTNVNRFAALQPQKKNKVQPQPKPKKKKPKKVVKPPQRKKLYREKYPTDYAKEFVEAVPPQDGYTLALRFLVWGGVGGAPIGRGVLIPGSLKAFPATPQGICKSRERYLPLLEVLGRVWPGFLAALLTHLVDFVLSIETKSANEGSQDESATRKLFFLSSWIHFLVSHPFVQKLYPEAKENGKKGVVTENSLATIEQLEPLNYPLNSLCDRCKFHDVPGDFRKTSQIIFHTMEEVLSSQRVQYHGLGTVFPTSQPVMAIDKEPTIDEVTMATTQAATTGEEKMSLEEMEALLSDEEVETTQSSEVYQGPRNQEVSENTNRPVAWTRCVSWDPCAIGTMPGYPV